MIEPTPQEKARDRKHPHKVIVDTWSNNRVLKPADTQPDPAFEAAFAEASEAGFEAIALVSVAEYFQHDPQGMPAYRYVWEFTAHRVVDGTTAPGA